MDPTFTHPLWIVAGIVLILAGLWLFRWARRNDASDEIAAATAEAAFDKFRKNSQAKGGQKSPAAKKASSATYLRNSMAQLAGIVGGLMMLAGLVAIVFGVFYVSAGS